jgi:serine/threonine protein kinase
VLDKAILALPPPPLSAVVASTTQPLGPLTSNQVLAMALVLVMIFSTLYLRRRWRGSRSVKLQVVAQPVVPSTFMIGPYQVERELGEGGMGKVWLGRSLADGSWAAIKVIHPYILAQDPQYLLRFQREADAASLVNDPYVAKIVAADIQPVQPGQLPWIAYTYVDAPTLEDYVKERYAREQSGLSVPEVLKLAYGMAHALLSFEIAGIVHRDIKPANILWAAHGPVVIDLGIALFINAARLTQPGTGAIGTLGYLSPERVRGGEITIQSDIFSLGTVLYFACTGEDPFANGTDHGTLSRVVNIKYTPNLGNIPRPLKKLIGMCHEKEPHKRTTPSELLAYLDKHGA